MPGPSESLSPPALARAHTRPNIPWCPDFELMISGMRYSAFAPELTTARARARALVHAYNATNVDALDPTLPARREEMLRGFMGGVGRGVFLEPPVAVDYGCNIILGNGVYANFGLTILDCAEVTIGPRVMFGPNVNIITATHETSPQSRRDQVEFALPVSIGADSWIGASVVILPGVTIGKGCTVGAGSVVTKDVPDWSVVVGNPARVVRMVEPVPDVEGDDSKAVA